MSDLWKFSSKTNPSMRRCVSMAGPRGVRNKWLQEFKDYHFYSEYGKSLYNLLRNSGASMDAQKDAELKKIEVKQFESTYAEFLEAVEAEPVARFDYMLEKGSKNRALFKILAERLSDASVDKIYQHLFDTQHLNPQALNMLYLENFYRHFLPVYLKRPYNQRISLFILNCTYKYFPHMFRIILSIIIQDPEVSNIMTSDLVKIFDDAGKYEFLSTIMELELSSSEFARNLNSICTAYNTAEKTEHLQNYIYNSLLLHAGYCTSNWHYGKLLLAYLHASGSDLNFLTVERLIEMHRSPFKRPCMTVLSHFQNLNRAAQPPFPT